MKIKCIICLSVGCLYIVTSITYAAQPVDTELIPEARKVLDYLESVYGKKTLTGMSSYGGWRPVYEITGLAPAIYANDAFGWNRPKWGQSYSRVLQDAINSSSNWWHEKGGIVSLQFHWGKPGDPNGSAWVSEKGRGTGPVDVARTITSGTQEHQAAMEDLRRTADYLELLAKDRVPVLWRPFHEIDGGWFWWTDKEKPENTAALWRMMFDYFVKERKLHNLIWVYSAGLHATGLKDRDVQLEQEIAHRKRFYPGDNYVDIAGIDIYPNSWYGWGSFTDDTYPKAYEIMRQVAPGKMLALCETAALVNPDQLEKQGPHWLYCLPWFTFRENSPEWIRKTFSHEHYLTLDELPKLVPHNTAPNVRLLRPTDGSQLVGEQIGLRARAQDRDGNLKSVEFYLLPGQWKNWFLREDNDLKEALAQATRLGEGRLATDGTWTMIWSKASPGLHNIVAVAKDSDGISSMSNVTRVSIGLKNLANGCKITASSDTETAIKVLDGDLFTSWNGDKKGEQWLSVDLGAEQTIGGIVVCWWKAYARAFQIQISTDVTIWKDVFRVENKNIWHGDSDVIRFEPVKTRYVRLLCTKPGTDWGGYTIYEFSVFALLY